MIYLQGILSKQIGENSVESLLMALALFVGLFLFFKLFQVAVLHRLKKLVKTTDNDFDDALISVIQGINWVFYFVVSLYFPLKYLVIDTDLTKWLNGLFVVVVVYEAINLIQGVIEYFIKQSAKKKGVDGAEADAAFYGIKLIVKMILWTMGLLLILSNLGFNINSLIASLGIGGVAIALAVQNILGDVFSSFSIYFDKPFKVGDFIIAGEHMGTVKKVGLKTTRLQALQGEELIISNKELTNCRIQNFKRMRKRRVVLRFALVYGTKVAGLKKANDIVQTQIEKIDSVEFERCHFYEFGDYSLNFEAIYFVNSNDYKVFMDKQQEVDFAIKEKFEKEGIEMAFPTQTVYYAKNS